MNKTGIEGEQYSIDVLGKVEEILKTSGVDHRFVGGIIANPIGPETRIAIDAKNKTAEFAHNKALTLVRPDGSLRDIDLIGFSPIQSKYIEVRALLSEQRAKFEHNGYPYPPISIEPTHYPAWPKRNRLIQFVSTLDVDENYHLYMVFGGVRQHAPWNTMEAWTVSFQEGLELTSINPYGLRKRYEMRNASGIKRKDRQPEEQGYSKIDLLDMIAASVAKQGMEQGVNYREKFESWDEFIFNLQNHPDPLTYAKALVTRGYWNTIGTALAHGKGVFAPFASLGDKFTG